MTIKLWLEHALHDADRRGLAGLKPLLEALARSTAALRMADWNDDATGATATSAAGRTPAPSAPTGYGASR
jgi:hypothetical protein